MLKQRHLQKERAVVDEPEKKAEPWTSAGKRRTRSDRNGSSERDGLLLLLRKLMYIEPGLR